MKNSKIRQGSFLTLLIKNYVFFTLSTVAMIIFVCYSFLYFSYQAYHSPRINRLIQSREQLEEEKYEELKAGGELGESGYFQVLNRSREVVYSSRDGEEEGAYTRGELECIRNYSDDAYVEITDYKDKTGNPITMIQYVNYSEADEKKDIGYVILDKNRTILESSYGQRRKSYTRREFEFLAGSYNEEYDVEKYSFKNKEREQRMLLIFTKKPDAAAINRGAQVLAFLLPTFLVCYILMTLFFVYWMNRKIKQPLDILQKAMNALAKGERNLIFSYKGPREFMEICESYNRMIEILKNTEEEKRILEKEKRKILADISHDLKTPVTVIQGYAKAIKDGLVPEKAVGNYLDTIYQKSQGLTEQINAFYDYNKLEHPEFQLHFVEKNICEYMRAYLANKYDEIMDAGFELQVDVPEEEISCRLDVVQLKHVFENIIGNTMKHTPQGTQIDVRMEQIGEYVSIQMGDNGSGIGKELFKGLFEPFTVGDESRTNRQGSGLGLAIAKKIVEAHGGTIRLLNEPRRGLHTEFEILLPILFS